MAPLFLNGSANIGGFFVTANFSGIFLNFLSKFCAFYRIGDGKRGKIPIFAPVMDDTDRRYVRVVVPVKFPGAVLYGDPGLALETGDWVDVRFGARTLKGVVSQTGCRADLDPGKIRDVLGKDGHCRALEQEIRLWEMMAEYYMCSVGEVFRSAYPAGKVEREERAAQRLQEKEQRLLGKREELKQKLEREFARIAARSARTGETVEELCLRSRVLARTGCMEILEGERLESLCRELMPETGNAPIECAQEGGFHVPELSPAQKECMEEAEKAAAGGKPVLLEGVTGSGKTEIYAEMAARRLAAGKQVLVMVPEIALSRQLEDRFRGYFPGNVIIYHSKETLAVRDRVAQRLRSGEACLVLGTRSALLLPWKNPGLIVVDEEHDSSYKQEEPAPRYNARDTAIMLASITGSPVVLGSATPSYESLFNALSGRFAHVKLERTFYEGGHVRTVVIDTLQQRKMRAMHGSISFRLKQLMQQALDARGQIMLFRSRRSYAPVLQCSGCGKMPKCPHCNVYLSYHKESGMLECHYCGSRYRYTGQCPECSAPLVWRGAGTERIEEEVRKLFPDVPVARLDSDTARKAGYEREVLRSFAAGQTRILVGTQLITKGLDFSNVSLVAVIGADSLIGAESFRADEAALQMLIQFRGRCARRSGEGVFAIQTEQPMHPVYQRLEHLRDPMEGLAERKQFNYPPFTRMVEIIIRSTSPAKMNALAEEIYEALSRNIRAWVSAPVSPAIDKIAGRYIKIVRVRLARDRQLKAAKKAMEEAAGDIAARYSGCEVIFNPDPI